MGVVIEYIYKLYIGVYINYIKVVIKYIYVYI